jgi:chromosome segregation ATPase
MDMNKFYHNVSATKNVLNTDERKSESLMLSVLSTLDDTYAEASSLVQVLKEDANVYDNAVDRIESASVKQVESEEKVFEWQDKLEDLILDNRSKENDFEQEVEDKKEDLAGFQEKYQEAWTEFRDADSELTGAESEASQVLSRLENQIDSLLSGADALGISVDVTKYENVRDSLEQNMSHAKYDDIGF